MAILVSSENLLNPVTGGKRKLAEEGEKFQPLPKGEPEVLHQVWVYQVT